MKELTDRNNGWSNEFRIIKLKRYIQGWINYFKLADMKRLLLDTDEWMRRRIRMIYWKQWKKVKTRFIMLKHYGVNNNKAWQFANTRKGGWMNYFGKFNPSAMKYTMLCINGRLVKWAMCKYKHLRGRQCRATK